MRSRLLRSPAPLEAVIENTFRTVLT